jgi:hypothetical protein
MRQHIELTGGIEEKSVTRRGFGATELIDEEEGCAVFQSEPDALPTSELSLELFVGTLSLQSCIPVATVNCARPEKAFDSDKRATSLGVSRWAVRIDNLDAVG